MSSDNVSKADVEQVLEWAESWCKYQEDLGHNMEWGEMVKEWTDNQKLLKDVDEFIHEEIRL